MIARIASISGVLWSVFRAPGLAVLLWLVFPVYWLLVSLGLIIDRVFFRRGPAAASTIVIAGPPRSGTTFLHRFLDDHSAARATRLWETLVPALCWQKLLRRGVQWAAGRGWPGVNLAPAHVTGVELAETDDLQIFARYADSFFYYVYVLSFRERDGPEYLNAALRPARIAARDVGWLRRAARRNRVNGQTNSALLKSFSAGFALAETHAGLDEPRIVYVSRAPHETLPSSLSMVQRVLGLRGLYARTDEAARRRHVERLLQASLALQQAAIAGIRRLPDDAVLIVRYEELLDDFAATMERILAFTGLPRDARLTEEIALRSKKQRDYASAHKYHLEDFGLTERRIREEFRDVYAFFGH